MPWQRRLCPWAPCRTRSCVPPSSALLPSLPAPLLGVLCYITLTRLCIMDSDPRHKVIHVTFRIVPGMEYLLSKCQFTTTMCQALCQDHYAHYSLTLGYLTNGTSVSRISLPPHLHQVSKTLTPFIPMAVSRDALSPGTTTAGVYSLVTHRTCQEWQ